MQEEMMPDFPEQTEEEEQMPEPRQQSCTDVFLVQYCICTLILLMLFAVRLYDKAVFQNAVNTFHQAMQADSEPWVLALLEQVQKIWN